MSQPVQSQEILLKEIRGLIEEARRHVAQAANYTLTLLHWKLGSRIHKEILHGQRAEYGEEILPTLSAKLIPEYGKGFSARNLSRMSGFAEAFPDERVVTELAKVLSWSHFVEILPLKQPLERDFYAEMCRIERWSVRVLRERIGSQLYLRTAIAKKPETAIKAELENLRNEGRMTPDMVFRDPYMLDFLRLPVGYNERDLEAAILREMEAFLLELGDGFCFVERQKRMTVGADDFYLDLLFYHRHLKRLIAVELKLEKFQPAHTGQMELYLRWLDKHERAAGEETPVGLILCAGADAEQVQLLQLDGKSIRVAEYLVELPEHWQIAHLKRLIDKVDYGLSETSDEGGKIEFLTMSNIQDGEIIHTEEKFLNNVSPDLLLQPGEILFNRTNSLDLVSKVGIYRGNDKHVTFASYLVKFRCHGRVNPYFLCYYLGCTSVLAVARVLALPSVSQANLNPNRYGYIFAPFPPKNEQAEIVNYIEQQIKKLIF